MSSPIRFAAIARYPQLGTQDRTALSRLTDVLTGQIALTPKKGAHLAERSAGWMIAALRSLQTRRKINVAQAFARATSALRLQLETALRR